MLAVMMATLTVSALKSRVWRCCACVVSVELCNVLFAADSGMSTELDDIMNGNFGIDSESEAAVDALLGAAAADGDDDEDDDDADADDDDDDDDDDDNLFVASPVAPPPPRRRRS
jgi:hypothetical protein